MRYYYYFSRFHVRNMSGQLIVDKRMVGHISIDNFDLVLSIRYRYLNVIKLLEYFRSTIERVI